MFDKLLARIQAATLAARHRPQKKPPVRKRAGAVPTTAHEEAKRSVPKKVSAKPKHRKGRGR